jgi:hypothetical protein
LATVAALFVFVWRTNLTPGLYEWLIQWHALPSMITLISLACTFATNQRCGLIRQAVAALAIASAVGGCNCDKCTTILVRLPNLDQATTPPVTVSLRLSTSSSVVTSCSWSRSQLYGGEWSCTKDHDGNTLGHNSPEFAYQVANAQNTWSIVVTGSSGTQTVTRNPKMLHPNDNPAQCSCDPYEVDVLESDLTQVGAVGIASVDAGDAG